MGTNFYLHKGVCPTCNRAADVWHIGKSSAGWCFSLHIMPNEGINDLPDWVEAWNEPETRIMDEYGREVTPDDMLSRITERSGNPPESAPWGYGSWDNFHTRNHSEMGPKNLLRHRIDGRHCTGHGTGTWDLMIGEFS